MEAYEDMINETSTVWASWYIIPADHERLARSLIADIITKSIMSWGIKPPVISEQKLQDVKKAKKRLK